MYLARISHQCFHFSDYRPNRGCRCRNSPAENLRCRADRMNLDDFRIVCEIRALWPVCGRASAFGRPNLKSCLRGRRLKPASFSAAPPLRLSETEPGSSRTGPWRALCMAAGAVGKQIHLLLLDAVLALAAGAVLLLANRPDRRGHRPRQIRHGKARIVLHRPPARWSGGRAAPRPWQSPGGCANASPGCDSSRDRTAAPDCRGPDRRWCPHPARSPPATRCALR